MATYTLVTPTLEQGPIGGHRLHTHFKQRTKSYTIILSGGTYSLIQFPSEDELVEYTAYYMGGCQHTGISEAIRTAMIADGIVTSANFTQEQENKMAQSPAQRAAAAKIAAGKKADASTRSSMPKLTKMVVSQATINKIKTDGMTAALKKVGAGKASASYVEGAKRMYGAARINAAKKTASAKSQQNSIVSSYGSKAPKSGGGKGMSSY